MDQQTNSIRHACNTILILIFMAALCVPMAARILKLELPRHPAPIPVIAANGQSFWAFPSRFTLYFNDRFPFRTALIRWHALAVYRGLDATPSNVMLLGRDGWIYYADDHSLDDYHSATPLTDAELAEWKNVLEDRRAWLAARGIHYLFVLVPDKHVVYPEHMPPAIRRVHEEYRMDQLAAYLAANSKVDVLDLRQPLEEQKKIERVYHLTDTHWNDRGAFVGYQQIMRRVAAWYPNIPGVEPLPREAFEAVSERTPGLDLPAMVGLSDATSEETLALIPRLPRKARIVSPANHDARWNDPMVVLERDVPTLPGAVVLRDSFGSALVPFLAEHFRRSVFFWEYDFDTELIQRERPGVVIQEMAGRKLYQVVPYNPASVTSAHKTLGTRDQHDDR